MKKHRLAFIGLIAGLSAFAVTSCTYDPYYSGTSYSGGYGNGYGYGSSNFSTSFFVSTGNSRWAYDPYASCYYDYTRRAYYDPHLCGYYPVGYRPRYVVGAPHPHGWYRGSNYCPPPSRINNHTIDRHTDRAQSYRSLGREWSRNVIVSAPTTHQRPAFVGRDYQDRGFDGSRGSGYTQRAESFPSRGGYTQRGSDDRGSSVFGQQTGAGGLGRQNPRQSVTQPTPQMNRREEQRSGPAGGFSERQTRQQIERPTAPPQPRMERSAPPALRESGGGGRSRSESPGSGGESRGGNRSGIRSLGEG